MSTVKTNNVQVGQSGTASNNFTLYQPAVPDGTVRIGVGNAGATTLDVLTASSAGNISIPGTLTIAGQASSAFSVYTGTVVTNSSYPVGSYVIISAGATNNINVNTAQAVWSPPSAGSVNFFTGSAGPGAVALAGTWRARGSSVDTSVCAGVTQFSYFYLMQRTA